MTNPKIKSERFRPGKFFWIYLMVLTAAAILMNFLPLFNVLGYEFSLVVAVLVSVGAPLVARSVVKHRQIVWPEGLHPWWIVIRLSAVGWLLNLLALLAPLALSALNVLRVKNCSLGEGLLFYFLLPVAGAFLWSATGTALGFLFPGKLLGGLATFLAWSAVAAKAGWEFYQGPAMDSFNAICGWIAGPIFEEAIVPSWPLVFSRLQDMAWAVAWLALAAAFFDPRWNRPNPRFLWKHWRRLATFVLTLLVPLALGQAAEILGFGRSWKALKRSCPIEVWTENFVIHLPAQIDPARIEQYRLEHELRLEQIKRDLEMGETRRFHSWILPSSEEKRKLTGAGTVQFAKPWQPSMFLNHADFPHPVLKHELVHLVAGHCASTPLRTSARWWFWQNVGLLEGLAVALDWPYEYGSPHLLAATMFQSDMAPAIEDLFDPIGFWSKAGQRAYALAGSFVRWLIDEYGPLKLCQAYQKGKLEGIYPSSEKELFARWRAFVKTLPVPNSYGQVASLKMSRPAVFEKPCAHHLAEKTRQIQTAISQQNPGRAERLAREWLSLVPEDKEALETLYRIKKGIRDWTAAEKILKQLLRKEELLPVKRAQLEHELADLAWQKGDRERAKQIWTELLFKQFAPEERRALWAKIASLDHGLEGQKVIDFLIKGKVDGPALIELSEALRQDPNWAVPWYLLGRQLFFQRAFTKSLEYFEQAARLGMELSEMRAEILRLSIRAAWQVGKYRQALLYLSLLEQYPEAAPDPGWARDWFELIWFSARDRAL